MGSSEGAQTEAARTRRPGKLKPPTPVAHAQIDRIVRLNLLFDFYGPLLTQKQRTLFALYHQEDLSLGEIAQQEGVSRQAVHDIIRRSEAALEQVEVDLGFAATYVHQESELREIVRSLHAVSEACVRLHSEAGSELAEQVDAVSRQLEALVEGPDDRKIEEAPCSQT